MAIKVLAFCDFIKSPIFSEEYNNQEESIGRFSEDRN